MEETDPGGMAWAGVELAVALAAPEDNVGIVAYNSDAEVVCTPGAVGGTQDRGRFAEALGGVERQYKTNFIAALDLAGHLLDGVGGERERAVIFLSDGGHNPPASETRRPEHIGLLAQEIASRHGARIMTIAFGDLVEGQSLFDIALASGGGHFGARTPRELFEAYREIATELYGLLARHDSGGGVRVPPGCKRLIYLTRGAARLVGLTHEGAALGAADVVLYPAAARPGLLFSTAQRADPPAGLYAPLIEGDAEEVLLLIEPAFSFAISALSGPAAAPGVYAAGAPLGVTVTCAGAPADLAAMASFLSARAILRGADGAEAAAAPLWVRAGAGALTLEGELLLPAIAEVRDFTIAAQIDVELGETRWPFSCTKSLRVAPAEGPLPAPAPLAAALAGAPAELGERWLDAGPIAFSLTLTGDATRSLAGALAAGPPAISCGGPPIALAPGAEVPLALTLDPGALGAGAHEVEGALLLRAPSGATQRLPFAARCRLVAPPPAEAPRALGALAPGAPPVVLGAGELLGAAPPPGLVLADAALRGPAGAALTLAATPGGLRLAAPPGTPPGRYEGEVTLTLGGAARRLPVTLEVAPERVVFAAQEARPPSPAGGGAARFDFSLALPPLAPGARLELRLGPLRERGGEALLLPDYDARLAAADGLPLAEWGPERRLTLEAELPSDAPAGRYEGAFTVRTTAADGTVTERVIALEVELAP
jgi:hypothetical protein